MLTPGSSCARLHRPHLAPTSPRLSTPPTPAEIVHIVLWKLKPFASEAAEQAIKAGIAELTTLEGPELMHLGPPAIEGRNKGYNWGLYSIFPDRETLDKYAVSEAHLKVVTEKIKPNFDGELQKARVTRVGH